MPTRLASTTNCSTSCFSGPLLTVTGRRIGVGRDGGAGPETGLEPACLDQVPHHLVRRIGMDLQVRRECTPRRTRLTRLEFTAHERLDERKHHLVEDRLARPGQ